MNDDILKDAKFYAVDVVNIKSTDVIVLRIDVPIPVAHAENIKSRLREYFPDNQIVVLYASEILIARKES